MSWKEIKYPKRTNRFQKAQDREAESSRRNVRERGPIPTHRYGYFINPQVYLVLLETAPEGTWRLAVDNTEKYQAVLGFLSPLDAAIEGALRAKPGLRYQVQPAYSFRVRDFMTTNGYIALVLHFSWLALDRRIVLSDGVPNRLSRVLFENVKAGMPETFDVEARALDDVDYLYECAGLYAWEDAHKQMSLPPPESAVQIALRTGHPMQQPPEIYPSSYEFALFDPDGMRWHYLPYEILGDGKCMVSTRTPDDDN